jgi:predicted secreted protein
MNRLTIKLNQTVQIDLPGKGTSGYEWSWTSQNKNMLKITQKYIVPEQVQAGGIGTERFSITGLEPGVCKVEFKQTRSWEKDKLPLDSMDYEVTVYS